MSVKSLLNQSSTLYIKSSYSRYGRKVFGGGTAYKARVQRKTKQKLLPNGDLITILLVAYFNPGVTILSEDKVTYDSVDYKVFSVESAVDGQGNDHHTKVELVKWQE